MLKNFATWFVVFGLSFLVSDVFGWTEQGKAFLFIRLSIIILLVIIFIALLMTSIKFAGFDAEALGISAIFILFSILTVFVALFAAWCATKLFDVDFYVAYQIMTFGQCLCVHNDKKKKDD